MYQSFIGLEIHIHLNTATKAFCGCKAHFGDEPNTNVCPVCMGLPGTLPQLNVEALRQGYAVARALHCELSPRTVFERKNYFYPDMPKNYQISQFAHPVGINGWLEITVNGTRKRVRIHDVHFEEDAGKMIHAGDMSLLDYNRAGYPLLEIVTEPDLEKPEEAEILLHELRRLVRAMGVSDGNMEEGSLRCDANVSINTPGAGLGRKVEIKNLNSSRFVRKSLLHEIERQSVLLDKGQAVVQETRLWNENRDQTESMRSKESAHDYRYFPEPDLPPFVPDQAFLQSLDALQVEIPLDREDRFVEKLGIQRSQAEFLCQDHHLASYFEEVLRHGVSADLVATWLQGDVQKFINKGNQRIDRSPLTAPRLGDLLARLEKGSIHGKLAKQILEEIFARNQDPGAIIADLGLETMNDDGELVALVDQVLAGQEKACQEYLAGDQKVLGFLMGQVMRASKGRAQPQKVQELLAAALSARADAVAKQ